MELEYLDSTIKYFFSTIKSHSSTDESFSSTSYLNTFHLAAPFYNGARQYPVVVFPYQTVPEGSVALYTDLI
jgi:hypothetical protein